MPYNNPKGLIAESVILELLAATCVGLRFLSRRKRRVSFAADDWLMVVALIGATGLTVMQIWGRSDFLILDPSLLTVAGCATGVLGVPLDSSLEDVPALTGRIGKAEHVGFQTRLRARPTRADRAQKIELATIALGVPTLGMIRLSLACLYKRIFITRTFRIIVWVWILLVSTWTVGFVLSGLLECGSNLWALFGTPATYHHYCGSAIKIGYAMVGSSVAMDVITLLLPLPMVSDSTDMTRAIT